MINRVVLMGRLTRDPELRRTSSGTAVTTITIAFNNRTKDAQGNNTTSFVNVNVFGKSAEFVCNYCKKGTLVSVDGRIQERKYTKRDGTNASVIEVVADSVETVIPRNASQQTVDPSIEQLAPQEETVEEKSSSDDIGSLDFADDDLPF